MKTGLINGLSGDALILFLSPEKKNRDEGLKLLNIVSEEITTSTDYSFDTGITGFGWLVAFLHQERLIDIDSDDILEDFDDQIYKLTLQELSEQNMDINTLLGFIDYHIIRHRNKNFNEQQFRKFLHQECINLMVEKLNTLIGYYISQKELTQKQIENSCKILLKFSYLSNYINNKIISDQLPDQLYHFIKYTQNNLQPDSNLKKQSQKRLWQAVKNKNYKVFITQLEIDLPKVNYRDLKETLDINNIIYNLTNTNNQ
ncbi:hypothetical protein [Elizabethkingia bruuniana]|uniref:hypothetical protein n=1 Tax=Elizabethkingia bruuniana TaxID=1756149 RepID=UPI00241EDE38|nr:hypothetical protein [Elizabethkingia bruuniana]